MDKDIKVNEKVIDDNSVLLNDINKYIEFIDHVILEQCNIHKYDPDNIKPLNFMFILYYIGDYIYKNNKSLLKLDNNIYGAYDPNKIGLALEVFIRLCMKYNQYFTLSSFEAYTGISHDLLYDMLSSKRGDFLQIMHKKSEDVLTLMLTDKQLNPMHVLPILNYKHRWSAGVLESELQVRDKIGVQNMPKFEIGTGFIKPDNNESQ